jgi:uncharacterized protein YceK
MNTTLSTQQLRLIGLLVLVLVLGGGYMVVSHKSTTQNTQTTASSTPATTTPAPSKGHSHPVTPAPHKLATHGLPVPVARALQKHSVVVVALGLPSSNDDVITAAEAQAGAKASHAGFVAIDVLNQKNGTAMLHKLGVVDTPVVLVVKRPANIYSEFHGLVDRAVVAQAVAEAR